MYISEASVNVAQLPTLFATQKKKTHGTKTRVSVTALTLNLVSNVKKKRTQFDIATR